MNGCLKTDNLAELELIAAEIRKSALDMVYRASSGHIGGSFSMCELLAALYFNELRIDHNCPADKNRDRFVLSKGHCTPALYSALALRGYFPKEELLGFRDIDSHLSGHAEMRHVKGVDMSTGSLGQGLSAAVGMALAGRIDKSDYRVYAVLGDGELQEGQIWEASMAAGNFALSNLCAIVDNNNIQIDGTVDEIMSPYPIDEKFAAFGWNVICCKGHDIADILSAFDKARACKDKPSVIIASTIKGKGVSFMENSCAWHGNNPNEEQYNIAAAELSDAADKAREAL
ncbi:MAG: transketolase [Ruminococcaceae bacterium]|nr:transketolase [Oscillospiraceae bacterium]